jgi:glycosyltransferase involved in cell wall biosynthesis
VITYVARNLEPYRGFHTFMRALPAVLAARPKAQVLIVGGDEVSYGRRPANGECYREITCVRLGDAIDTRRVHFLGKVPYRVFLDVLRLSCARLSHLPLRAVVVAARSHGLRLPADCLRIPRRSARSSSQAAMDCW